MIDILPLPSVPLTGAQKQAKYEAVRRANMKAWGVVRQESANFRGAATKAEQVEAAEVVVPQAPVVHESAVAAFEYDNTECLACQ